MQDSINKLNMDDTPSEREWLSCKILQDSYKRLLACKF